MEGIQAQEIVSFTHILIYKSLSIFVFARILLLRYFYILKFRSYI